VGVGVQVELTRHSLLVSTIRSPRTNPQFPQTRSPLPNSSTIFGFGSLHSGQMRRTARSGPNDGGCTLFCGGAAKGKGCEYAIVEEDGDRGCFAGEGTRKVGGFSVGWKDGALCSCLFENCLEKPTSATAGESDKNCLLINMTLYYATSTQIFST
jgi:hypothetical protein